MACAAIGFADDYAKISNKRSLGLAGRWKLALLVPISAVLGYVAHHEGLSTRLYVPLFDIHVDLGWGWYGLVFLVLAGSTSAVNLTDGLDGLAAGTSAIAFLAYTALATVGWQLSRTVCADGVSSCLYVGPEGDSARLDLAVFAAAMLGCCIGFLWYNSFPAQVFMGDTGSLGLGGALGAMAVLHEDRAAAADHRRRLRDRGALGDHPGHLVPALRAAHLPDGADPPPFRDEGVVGDDDHRALLDRRRDARGLGLRARLPAVQRVHLMDEVLAGARRVVVLGAVRSGIAAAEALGRCAPHVHVVLADRRPDAGEVPAGVEAMLGRDDPELLAGADLLVKSPGVPEEAAIVRAARSAGIPVWAEVELAYRLLEERNPIVGITGTNGKTTATLLTAAMLERGGVPSAEAGNVGTALSSFAGAIEPGRDDRVRALELPARGRRAVPLRCRPCCST